MAWQIHNKCSGGRFLSLLFVLSFTAAIPASAQQGRAALLLALNLDLQTLASQTRAFYPTALTQYPITSNLLTAALMFDALGGWRDKTVRQNVQDRPGLAKVEQSQSPQLQNIGICQLEVRKNSRRQQFFRTSYIH